MKPQAPVSWRTGAVCVTAFAMFVAFAGLFALPPLDRDEARFAQATAQMMESGDYIAIRFQDRERNKKPAGVYWLQAASVAAFSDVEAREIWAYRLPAMAGVVLAAIFTFIAAARLYDPLTGLIAGLLLASAPLAAAEATIAKTDGVLLGLVAMAQCAFVYAYGAVQAGEKPGWGAAIAFWAAQGAGALVKGPISLMISALTALGLSTATPRFQWAAALRLAAGAAIFILIVAPWLFAISQATDGRFFADAFGDDMLGKLGDAQEGHAGPPGYHALLVWILFWPAAGLILPGLVRTWRERKNWRALFLLSWALPGWLFFELAATKLPHYVLPLYPALAIIAARAATAGTPEKVLRRAGAAVYAAAGLGAAAIIAAPLIEFAQAPALAGGLAALFAAATLLVAGFFWRGRSVAGALASSALAAVYAWTLLNGVLPGLSQFAVSPRLAAALDEAERHPLHDGLKPVAIAGYSEPSAVFLLGTETALTNPAHAAVLLKSGAVSAAIVEAREEATFAAALDGAPVEALAVIDGVNYSSGQRVSLTIYARPRAPESYER